MSAIVEEILENSNPMEKMIFDEFFKMGIERYDGNTIIPFSSDKINLLYNQMTDKSEFVDVYINKVYDTIFDKNDIWIDIGADVGQFAIKAMKKCKSVEAFIKDGKKFNTLLKNIRLNGSGQTSTGKNNCNIYWKEINKKNLDGIMDIRKKTNAIRVKDLDLFELLVDYENINKYIIKLNTYIQDCDFKKYNNLNLTHTYKSEDNHYIYILERININNLSEMKIEENDDEKIDDNEIMM